MIKHYISDLIKSKYIIISLAKLDIKSQYRHSFLGLAWNFLSPFFMCILIGSIYSILFSYPFKAFIPYLYSGLIPWLFISNISVSSCTAFLNAEGYIKQLNTPINIYPIRVVITNFANLLFSLLAYMLICIYLKPDIFNLQLLLVLPNLLIYLVASVSVASFNAYLHTYVRDFSPINSLFMQAMFYVTPIIYPASRLMETSFKWVVDLNPFYHYIVIFRAPLLNESISFRSYIITISISIIGLITATALDRKVGRKIVHKI